MVVSAQDFNPAEVTQYHLTLEVGSPLSFHGLTRVRLDGDGSFHADQTQEPEPALQPNAQRSPTETAAQGRVSQNDAVDLLRRVHQFPWDRKFPSRPGIPDEAIVVWQLDRAGFEPLVLRVWLREAEDDPVIGPVLTTLRRRLAEFSANRLYL